MNLRLRLLVEWAAIAFLSSLIVLLALQWRGTSAFDYLFYDQLSSLSRPMADEDIVLVTIDDPSLQSLGRWPWPRATHAQLLTKLQAAKPKAILLDILLSEPSDAAEDDALADAMRLGAPVYVPLHFAPPAATVATMTSFSPLPPLRKPQPVLAKSMSNLTRTVSSAVRFCAFLMGLPGTNGRISPNCYGAMAGSPRPPIGAITFVAARF